MVNIQHQCSDCAFTKEIVLKNVSSEDVEEYEKIQIALSSIQSANRPENMPKDASPDVAKAYFEVIFEKEAYYKQLEMAWWKRIMDKYKISENTKIDVNEKTFYHCLDKNGKEMIDFKAKSKPKLKVVKR
jgi:hypothetical protein